MQTDSDQRPFVIPADTEGLPSFEAYFDALYGALPAALLAQLAAVPSTLDAEIADHGDRLAGSFGYLSVGLAEHIVHLYADPDRMLAIFVKTLAGAVADAQQAVS